MRNSKLFIVFVITLLSVLIACDNDESTNNNGNPDSNDIGKNNTSGFEDQDFKLPAELVYTRKGQGFLYDKIYPIGWSKDGKFAYITEPADEGSGYYWFKIIIFDIVNNKEIWSWKPSESEGGNLLSVWKENYDLFSKHLNEAEILQVENFELKAPKTSYKGNDYELILDAKTVTDPDFGFDVVREVDISLVSPELGKKQIYNQKIDDFDYVVSAYVPGYMMSPHDDRIVVICQKERPGAEGPPNVVFFDLIGSDLIRGFKKDKDS